MAEILQAAGGLLIVLFFYALWPPLSLLAMGVFLLAAGLIYEGSVKADGAPVTD